MAIPLGDTISVRSELQVGATTAKFNVGFLETKRASWGGAVLGAAIGIEARF